MDRTTLAVRASALAAVLLAVLQALAVVAWYGRARLVAPPRAWHVVSVGVGWTLVELYLVVSLARTWVEVPMPPGAHASLALVGQVFVIYGTHCLYWGARRRERGSER